MESKIGQTIKKLRLDRDVSQETLAKALSVSTQAISKWENQKALPDIMLLPALAAFFHVSIDALFSGVTYDENKLEAGVDELLQINQRGWDNIARGGSWTGTNLPQWGVWMPNEDELHMLDVEGKKVLEIACGAGVSLAYVSQKGAKELWGLDLSKRQLEKAQKLLDEKQLTAHLFHSSMELNPGIPEHYFDCVYSVYGIGWTQDLDKTISLIARYLKTNGVFVFSWDNPMLPCIDTINGQYVLNVPYLDEPVRYKKKRGEDVVLRKWKLSSYINSLAKHGFKIEQLVEKSSKNSDYAVFDNQYYSEHKAQYIHHSFVLKARKM